MAMLGTALGGQVPAGAMVTNGRGRDGISNKRPRRGGSLTIGTNAEEASLSILTGRFDTAGTIIARALYDPLMAVTTTGAIVPYLASSLVPSDNYTKWTVTLRPNLKFHDGTPCDGEALVTNFNAAMASAISVALKPLVKGATQSGPNSMTIEMVHPWVTFPDTYAATQVTFVGAPSMNSEPNQGAAHPIGTGPFVFDEWVVNSHLTLKANPHYWRPGMPYLDEVTFVPIADDQARAEALQSGSIDLMITTSPTSIRSLHQDPSVAYVDNRGAMVGSPDLGSLMLNTRKAPFDDPLARRILATAISSKAYSRIINQGVIPPANGLFQPGSPYYSKTSYPKYDPAEARRLVSQYKAKHGSTLSFTSLAVATPQGTQQGEYLQQVLHNVGVNLNLVQINQNELIAAALEGQYEAMGWLDFGGISPDLNYVWFSPTTIAKSGISLNTTGNDDPQIETAMLAGMAATTSSERIKAYRTVNERLAVDLPYIWIDRSVWAIASNLSVENWNNPTSPGGQHLVGNNQGLFWLPQVWTNQVS